MVPRETRSKPFKVNLTPTMHERLSALAERLGMAPASLASIAIAEYVANKSGAFEAQRKSWKDSSIHGPQLQPLIDALANDIQKGNEKC